MGQEMSVIPESFREQLKEGFSVWQELIAGALLAAKEAGEIGSDVDCRMMAQVFWTGWEGAVMRARIEESTEPLSQFSHSFLNCLSC